MAIRDFLPLAEAPRKKAQILPLDDQKTLARKMRVAALALGFQGIPTGLSSRATFEEAPHDFERIIQAWETDSYLRQAIAKYRELFWKEGWEIVSENPKAVEYLWQRIDFMEVAMRRPFQDLLCDIADQLFMFHNVFVVKSRGDLAEFFPDPLYPPENKNPIIGYYLIPTEKVLIQRDKFNRPKWYKQRVWDAIGNSENEPKWNASEVIHLARDRRPGRAFGTPFLVNVLDDIVALRQFEEDVENLVHRELFPVYLYKIGDDEHPADQDEIDRAAVELENMRTEAGLILPHRHEVEVLGADGKTLDAGPYLEHFKQRVAIGLGLYPHHLGMSEGANRAATDRLDTALYDKIKEYQRFFSDQVRQFVFNEILIEGGFDPYVTPVGDGDSDRCIFKFREIDVDTQMKKENMVIQKYAANLLEDEEARLQLGEDSEIDESKLAIALQARMTPDQPSDAVGPPVKKGTTNVSAVKPPTTGPQNLVDTTPMAARKPDAANSSTGGSPNFSNKALKTAGNKARPTNQFGRKLSPNVRHDVEDETWLTEVVELLDESGDVYGD